MFSITADFSLDKWMRNHGQELGNPFDEYAISMLLGELEVAPFLRDEPCNRGTDPYISDIDGWSNGKLSFYRSFRTSALELVRSQLSQVYGRSESILKLLLEFILNEPVYRAVQSNCRNSGNVASIRACVLSV
jgi:hypothetical protein